MAHKNLKIGVNVSQDKSVTSEPKGQKPRLPDVEKPQENMTHVSRKRYLRRDLICCQRLRLSARNRPIGQRRIMPPLDTLVTPAPTANGAHTRQTDRRQTDRRTDEQVA